MPKSLYLMCIVLLSEADFLVGKKLLMPSFRDCLKERGTVQMLTVGREAAIEVQVCFQNISLVTCLWNNSAFSHSSLTSCDETFSLVFYIRA